MRTTYLKPEIRSLTTTQVVECLGYAQANVYGNLGAPGGDD